MNSTVDVFNFALGVLGQNAVSSPTQNCEAARVCNRFYDAVRRDLLRKHDFSFSIVNIHLPQVKVSLEDKSRRYKYFFARPKDCLFIKKIFDLNDASETAVSFEESFHPRYSMRVIACDCPRIIAKCVMDIKNEELFDPSFARVLALGLACEIAVLLTVDAQLVSLVHQKFAEAWEAARMVNHAERPEFAEQKSEILESMN